MIIHKFVKKISKKKCIVWGAAAVIFFIVFTIVFVGFGIYVLRWENNFVIRNVARVIHYPIMRINGEFISFSEYQKDVETLIKFYNYEADAGGLPVPSYDTMGANILERIKRNKIIEQMAKKEGIEVSKDELNEEFYKIMARAGSMETAEQTLKDIYGWSEKDFKKKIVKNIILQEKLKNKLGFNVDLDVAISEELSVAEIREYMR